MNTFTHPRFEQMVEAAQQINEPIKLVFSTNNQYGEQFLDTLPGVIKLYPETELHPSYQDFEYMQIKGGHKVFTHSEHLVLSLLFMVRQGHLAPEIVEVYYVDSENQVTYLEVDENGEFKRRWPEGFFKERTCLLM